MGKYDDLLSNDELKQKYGEKSSSGSGATAQPVQSRGAISPATGEPIVRHESISTSSGPKDIIKVRSDKKGGDFTIEKTDDDRVRWHTPSGGHYNLSPDEARAFGGEIMHQAEQAAGNAGKKPKDEY